MPNNKKVISFPRSGFWRFYDWVDGDGSNPIEKWLAAESDEVQMTFNSVLKEAGKRLNHLEWTCFRHKMNKELGAAGVNELGFNAQGRQYRLFVKFDGELQTVILCGCFHKGDKWTPTDALKTTVKRARALAQGKASRRERTIQDDL
ncbi:MAG: type II toxin-antitoxin system RelE/ParE family toxin [Terracidiphilus sp.]